MFGERVMRSWAISSELINYGFAVNCRIETILTEVPSRRRVEQESIVSNEVVL